MYELSDERTRGGGGLSLVQHIDDVFGGERGSVTGHWDVGHKLQLIFGDVLPKDDNFVADEKLIFDILPSERSRSMGAPQV